MTLRPSANFSIYVEQAVQLLYIVILEKFASTLLNCGPNTEGWPGCGRVWPLYRVVARLWSRVALLWPGLWPDGGLWPDLGPYRGNLFIGRQTAWSGAAGN